MWTVIGSGDRDQDHADRAAFLLASPDARADEVYRWSHAAEIKAQERREREEADEEQAKAEAARLAEESRAYRRSLEVPEPDGFDPKTYTGPAWFTGKMWTLGVPNLGWYRVEVTDGKPDIHDRMLYGRLQETVVQYPPGDPEIRADKVPA